MIAAFSITPIGTGESVGDLVAEAVGVVRESGLPSETNAMFTNVEGDWEEVMAVIKRCVDRLSAAAPRLSIVIKADIHPSAPLGQLAGKVERVERHLKRVAGST